MKLNGKLKTLSLHYHNFHGQKTYQSGEIPQGPSNHKFVCTLNEVFLEVMWQVNKVMSSLPEDPWTPNKASC